MKSPQLLAVILSVVALGAGSADLAEASPCPFLHSASQLQVTQGQFLKLAKGNFGIREIFAAAGLIAAGSFYKARRSTPARRNSEAIKHEFGEALSSSTADGERELVETRK